ncbi:MAG: DNA polymerase III subunit epsilon [Gammaproteobacteria bacterium]|nr:DNA polymerase III subunit epsilon [Gammaproteobacteria bacterium]
MRQIVLDTETTGLSTAQGHRIIEVGCIELVNRRFTGREYHRFINPERDIDEGAQRVHGISRADLEGQPRFADIAEELLEFLRDAELIIHNADFDVGFLEHELRLMKHPKANINDHATVLDTLGLARELHPGQRNSLDALCKRYEVDSSKRDVHGALIDAELLALVYLAMTGGQTALSLDEDESLASTDNGEAVAAERRADLKLVITRASEEELVAHEDLLDKIADSGRCVWRVDQEGAEKRE